MKTFTHTFPFDFHGQQVEATVEYTVEPGMAQTLGSPAEGPTLRGVKVVSVSGFYWKHGDPVILVSEVGSAAETMAQALWDEGNLPTEPEDTRTGVDD